MAIPISPLGGPSAVFGVSPSPIIPTPQPPETGVHHSLVVIHYLYPLFLLIFFLGSLTWWGIHTSSKKPPPAWASPSITAQSSPARGRSPNSGLLCRSNISRGGSDVSDSEEDHFADIATQGKLSDYKGIFERTMARFAAWFRGDLEDYLDPQSAQNKGFYKASKTKNVGLTPIRKAVLSWGLVIVIMSFMANSANIILHALVKPGWWCGQDVVVCVTPSRHSPQLIPGH